jgi:hypothetical protein
MASFPSDYNNKEKGMPILSAEWNDIVNEIDARLPKSGGHVHGPLMIGGQTPKVANRPLTVDGDAHVKGRMSVEGELLVTGTDEPSGRAGIGVSRPHEPLHVGGRVLAHEFRIPSDNRHQQNQGQMGPVLKKLLTLEAFSYQHRGDAPMEWATPDTRHYGLPVKALKKAFPELVTTYAEGVPAINYIGLIPILVHALRELSEENTKLDGRLKSTEEVTIATHQKLNALKTQVEQQPVKKPADNPVSPSDKGQFEQPVPIVIKPPTPAPDPRRVFPSTPNPPKEIPPEKPIKGGEAPGKAPSPDDPKLDE